MSIGHLTQLIQAAKTHLISDPFWYRSFTDEEPGSKDPVRGKQGLYRAATVLANLELVSKWIGKNKQVEIKVTPNITQVWNKKFFNSTTRRVIREFYDTIDWTKQKGSDSPEEAAVKDLRGAITSIGGKFPGTQTGKAKRTSGSVGTNIRRGDFAGRLDNFQTPGFDLSLLATLNAKLPPAVRSNMRLPALVNRTGRFSESVRIVGVETSKQGFPVLIYDYQRAPYDVFDPVIGAKPWNTPPRDPKKLIDQSIRDVMRNQAIGRFYTRRAD